MGEERRHDSLVRVLLEVVPRVLESEHPGVGKVPSQACSRTPGVKATSFIAHAIPTGLERKPRSSPSSSAASG